MTPCCPFLVRLVLGEEVGRVLMEISACQDVASVLLASPALRWLRPGEERMNAVDLLKR
jgi:hypothetical protein